MLTKALHLMFLTFILVCCRGKSGGSHSPKGPLTDPSSPPPTLPPSPDTLILDVRPNSSSTNGAQIIDISGINFDNNAEVKINGKECIIQQQTQSNIKCKTPFLADAEHHTFPYTTLLEVTNPDGKRSLFDFSYSYTEPPSGLTVSPDWGYEEGGNILKITGPTLAEGATASMINGDRCFVISSKQGELKCVAPSHPAQLMYLFVKNPDGQTNSYPYQYSQEFQPRPQALTTWRSGESYNSEGFARFGRSRDPESAFKSITLLAAQLSINANDLQDVLHTEFPLLFPMQNNQINRNNQTLTLRNYVGNRCYIPREQRALANFTLEGGSDLFLLNVMLECAYFGIPFEKPITKDYATMSLFPRDFLDQFVAHDINRQDVLAFYMQQVMSQRRVISRVGFEGEIGIDVGGVRREFFSILSSQLISSGIFVQSEAGHATLNSRYNAPENFHYKLGQMLNRVYLMEKMQLGISFSTYLLARLLGYKFPTLSSLLASVLSQDRNEFNMYMQTLNNPVPDDTFFFENRPEGEDAVTNENVYDFVKEQIENKENKNGLADNFVAGFNLDSRLLRSPAQLDSIIRQPATLDGLLSRLVFSNSCNDNTSNWFKEIISEEAASSSDFLNKFLRFVTGSESLPQRLEIRADLRNPASLPVAHTCFFYLDVANYPSKQVFKEKLLRSLAEASNRFDTL